MEIRFVSVHSALAALVLVVGAGPLSAQASFADADRLAKLRTALPEIDRLVGDFAEKAHVPGVAYGIIVDGRLIHAGVSGLRDVPSRPVRPWTPEPSSGSPR